MIKFTGGFLNIKKDKCELVDKFEEPEEGALRIRQIDKNKFYVDRYWSSYTYDNKTVKGEWCCCWDDKFYSYRTHCDPIRYGVKAEDMRIVWPTFDAAKAFLDEVLADRERRKLAEDKATELEQHRLNKYVNVFYPPDFEKVKFSV